MSYSDCISGGEFTLGPLGVNLAAGMTTDIPFSYEPGDDLGQWVSAET